MITPVDAPPCDVVRWRFGRVPGDVARAPLLRVAGACVRPLARKRQVVGRGARVGDERLVHLVRLDQIDREQARSQDPGCKRRAHEGEPQADRDGPHHAARLRTSLYPIPRTVSIGESPSVAILRRR